MADIFRFTDPENDSTVRLDISTRIDGAGVAGQVDWGVPDLRTGRRRLTIPLILKAASAQAMNDLWRDTVEQIEKASSFEVQIDGSTNGSVWFDQAVTEEQRPYAPEEDRSTIKSLYTARYGRRRVMHAVAELVCDPYARGAELTPVNAGALASAPDASNRFDISAPAGDVEAPANVEIVFDTTPNRLLAGLYRRTKGTVGNYVSLYEAESASLSGNTTSTVEASASNGNSTTTAPANQNMNLTHVWAISTNPSDRAGLVDVYVKVRDADTTPGRIKARLDIRHAGARDDTGETRTITADADHDGDTSYELWYLGTYRIPEDATSWDLRLHLQRTTGTAAIDIDYVAVLPADESVALLDWASDVDVSGSASRTFAFNTKLRQAWWGSLTQKRAGAALLGRGLWLKPDVTNRIIAQIAADTHAIVNAADDPPAVVVDGIASITVKYRPRFEFVR